MPVISMFYGIVVSLYFQNSRVITGRISTFDIRMMKRYLRFLRVSCWKGICPPAR